MYSPCRFFRRPFLPPGDHRGPLAQRHPQRPSHPMDHQAGHEAPRVPWPYLGGPPAQGPSQEGPPRKQPHRFLPPRRVEAPQHPVAQAVPLDAALKMAAHWLLRGGAGAGNEAWTCILLPLSLLLRLGRTDYLLWGFVPQSQRQSLNLTVGFAADCGGRLSLFGRWGCVT